jgi:hypothetical protein
MPEGVSLQQGTVPDWIGGPKWIGRAALQREMDNVALGVKRTAPFDVAHQLEVGKIRALEQTPHEMPDLLPAFLREQPKP